MARQILNCGAYSERMQCRGTLGTQLFLVNRDARLLLEDFQRIVDNPTDDMIPLVC